MADESRYIKLSPKLKRVVELDDLLGSLRVEILSHMLTPITWRCSGTGSSDFSAVLSVQARKLRKKIYPRKKVIFLCILKGRDTLQYSLKLVNFRVLTMLSLPSNLQS